MVTVLLLAALAVLSAVPASADVTYLVSIDTSSVASTSGFLDFQFNPGNVTTQAATATITSFNPDGGSLTGVPQVNGSVVGTLPGTLTFTNSTALNEYFQGFNYGSKISFLVTLSGPAINSPNGTATAGTTFGVGLYDSAQNPILTNQGGTTGFAGQIDINLNGSTTATAFPSNAAGTAPSVVTFTLIPPMTDVFQVDYLTNLDKGDSYVNFTNAGTLNGADPAGRICVNVYTFDPAEELISCCACPVTPNGLNSLSARNDLVSNTLTPGVPTSITVKLLSSAPLPGNTCNPSSPTAATLVRGMRAWATTLHLNTSVAPPPGVYQHTETPFSRAELSLSELTKLTSFCSFIQANGSGFGICKSCRAGALGAGEK